MADWSKPQEVDRVTMVFGGDMERLLPPMAEIPAEFKRDSNPWVKWQMSWFFRGLEKFPEAKPGIDGGAAAVHLKTIQGSFEPAHEHKTAAVAWLASQWLVAPTEAKT